MYDIILGRKPSLTKKIGTQGAIFMGKHYVRMGQVTSLSNKVYMDVSQSHVVFICGKRGCLTEDALVYTDSGYKKIKDFNEKKDTILSLNKNTKKFEWIKNAQLLSYPIHNEELFEFTFEDGQILHLTEEHPLLTHYCGRLTWKIASEIQKKDQIVSVYSLQPSGKKTVNQRIARLLGFLLADGTMQVKKGRFIDGRGHPYNGTKARLRIINGELNVVNQAKDDLDKEFNIMAKVYPKGTEKCWVVETKHQKVVNRLSTLGVPLGKKDKIICIPPAIWSASNAIKKEFLKALFSCDGFVDKNGARIVYYSNSLRMISDLNLILAHFDIQSRIREKKTTLNGKKFLSYQLDITDYTSVKNFQKIGFFQVEKNKRVKRRKFNLVRKRKSTTYLDNKLFCQKIKSIEKVKGIKKVYDLRVPKNHSFIANGIISHNSGKSYTMGAIAEGILDLPDEVKNSLSIIILDTMGIYWTMKFPNKQEKDLLEEWELDSRGLDVNIFTPTGYHKIYKEKGIPTDFPFSIKTSELSAYEWCETFGLKLTDPIGSLIERVIEDLGDKGKEYDIQDIIKAIQIDDHSSKEARDAAENRFLSARHWGLFDKQGSKLEELIIPGQITVLDVSCYASIPGAEQLRALVIGLVSQKMFVQRMVVRKNEEYQSIYRETHLTDKEEDDKDKQPLIWLIIDEAHEFLPSEGSTVASQPLITVLREGRQPGISLVLATQQPGKIHTDVITQSDIAIAHRVTAKIDASALGNLMQSYMREGLDKQLNYLPRVPGAALIFDDANEKLYPMRMRPRYTWHGGGTPSILIKKKELFEMGL